MYGGNFLQEINNAKELHSDILVELPLLEREKPKEKAYEPSRKYSRQTIIFLICVV